MIQVLDSLEIDDTGGFFAWTGKELPW